MYKASLRFRILTPTLAVLVVLTASGCGSTKKVESSWPERPVVVDGHDEEWTSPPVAVEDGKVLVSTVNDDTYLYVRVATRDRAMQAQILGPGLIVWLAPDGEKSKKIGIRFPIGVQGRGGRLLRRRETGTGGEDLEARWPRFEEQLRAFEILDPDGNPLERRLRASSEDIEVSMSYEDGLLVYELKAPLRTEGGHTYAVGVAPGQAVAVGLETPEIARETPNPDFEAGNRRRDGRRGGLGGRGGFGDRGRTGGLRPSPPDRLDAWITVHLAEPKGAAK